MADAVTKEYSIMKDMLGSGETVELEVVEHRLGGARLFEPAHVFATNYSVIVVRRNLFGFHSDYKIIKYESITDVKLERGLMFCRIHFSLLGEQEDDESAQKWLVGLKYKDALQLIHIVDRMEQRPVKEINVGSEPAEGKLD